MSQDRPSDDDLVAVIHQQQRQIAALHAEVTRLTAEVARLTAARAAPLPAACPHGTGPLHETAIAEQFQTEIPRRPLLRRFRVHVGQCDRGGRGVRPCWSGNAAATGKGCWSTTALRRTIASRKRCISSAWPMGCAAPATWQR